MHNNEDRKELTYFFTSNNKLLWVKRPYGPARVDGTFDDSSGWEMLRPANTKNVMLFHPSTEQYLKIRPDGQGVLVSSDEEAVPEVLVRRVGRSDHGHDCVMLLDSITRTALVIDGESVFRCEERQVRPSPTKTTLSPPVAQQTSAVGSSQASREPVRCLKETPAMAASPVLSLPDQQNLSPSNQTAATDHIQTPAPIPAVNPQIVCDEAFLRRWARSLIQKTATMSSTILGVPAAYNQSRTSTELRGAPASQSIYGDVEDPLMDDTDPFQADVDTEHGDEDGNIVTADESSTPVKSMPDSGAQKTRMKPAVGTGQNVPAPREMFVRFDVGDTHKVSVKAFSSSPLEISIEKKN